MLSIAKLTATSRARLKDAKALLSRKRYDGATYLCGYSVEIALKVRITKTLKWSEFPENSGEFRPYASFKSHNLEILLHLSGREAKIKKELNAEWSSVSQWDPESRYSGPGRITPNEAKEMIESASKIVKALL